MALFSTPKKAAPKKNQTHSGVKSGVNVLQRIAEIKAMVERTLGHLKDEYVIITGMEDLSDYIDRCIDNNVISIDTETDGLDPLQNKIVGICIYTPGQKAAYIPVNHVSYITGMRCPDQLTPRQCGEQFKRIEGIDCIMFNAQFDIRFMHQCGVHLKCTWDALLAGHLLNENEPTHALKPLHQKYVLKNAEDEFKFDQLFKGIPFSMVPIQTAYIYAAHDAIITYELYEFQKQFLDKNSPKCIAQGLEDVADVLHNIEMPMVDVIVAMEDTGFKYDIEYNSTLQTKYAEQLRTAEKTFYDVLGMYDKEIQQYKLKNPINKLSDPISISSPTQLAILFYDILGCKPVDKDKPRGTGTDILEKLKHPLCEPLLQYRGMAKLMSAFVEALPNSVNPKDGRIHCGLKSRGAVTGRMSCKEPNLQQIPSKNHDIRQAFTASDGYVLMSSDFSQQEPKALAALCSKYLGDDQLKNTFLQGKDLYSEIASKAFNVPYEECKEFRPDGTTNKEGKLRRTQAKSILLGVLYGRGEKSIAEQLNCTVEKAREIKESVFKGFPAIKHFEEDSIRMAKELGYVTTVCGSKRRLPEMRKPDYEFDWLNGAPMDNDPLSFTKQEYYDVPQATKDRYTKQLSKAFFGARTALIDEAKQEGIKITDNTSKKADATRQCVNSRIQGSAAELTKIAMIALANNNELKQLGFRLLIPVHDEVIIECPEENMKRVAQLLADTMCQAAENVLGMPIKTDVEITKRWYGEPILLEEE